MQMVKTTVQVQQTGRWFISSILAVTLTFSPLMAQTPAVTQTASAESADSNAMAQNSQPMSTAILFKLPPRLSSEVVPPVDGRAMALPSSEGAPTPSSTSTSPGKASSAIVYVLIT